MHSTPASTTSRAWSGRWRDLVEEVDLVPTSLAINGDWGLRPDRLMDQDELVAYMTRQIEAAARLGFPIARVQISLTPDSMEALLPVAERHGVTLALEVHAHQHGRHELILALRSTGSAPRCSASPRTGARR